MISIQFHENFAHFKYNRPEKSAMGPHCIETDHSFNKINTKLLTESIARQQFSNSWISYLIKLPKPNNLLLND